MLIKKLTLAGHGHGCEVALRSLQNICSSIELLSEDKKLIELLRSNDYVITNLNDSKSEVVVCAGYMEIIPLTILENKTVINTHPSLLPKYRGIHSLAWAMLNNEETVGFSIHLMNEFMDDGDILEQFEVDVNKQTSHEIMLQFDSYVLDNLGRVVREFLDGNIEPKKQDKHHATWCCRRTLNDCFIDFNDAYEHLEAQLRVLVTPYPLSMIEIKGKRYQLIHPKIIEEKTKMHNGRVVNIENHDVYIKTKDALLVVNEVKDLDSNEIIKMKEIVHLGMRLG